MAFRPLSPRDVRWRPAAGEGLEHLRLEPTPDGILARSVVIGARDGVPFGAAYQVRCDDRWRVRSLRIRLVDGRRLALDADGEGRWRTGEGAPLSAFAGCLDVDLSGSPFTNTLPIRRLDLVRPGEAADIQVLWIPLDTLDAFVDGQRYACLEPAGPDVDGSYHFEAADGSFAADIAVDADGLVTDYPALFRRA